MKKSLIAVGIATTEKGACININQDAVPPEMIISMAKEFGVPIIYNPELARQMAHFEMDDELPPELITAIEATIKHFKKENNQSREQK